MTIQDQCIDAAHTSADTAIDRTGLVGAGLLSLGLVGGKALASVGILVLVTAFVLALFRHGRVLVTDPLLRLGLVWMLWCGGLSWWAAQRFGSASALNGLFETWAFVFVPAVAWITRGRWNRILLCTLLAISGLALRTLLDLDFNAPDMFPYEFDALGMSRNRAVLFLNAGMLVCIAAVLHADKKATASHIRHRFVLISSIALLVLLAAAWHAAPSRASFVAFPVAALLVLIPVWSSRSAKAGMILLAIALLLLITLGTVVQRFAGDHQTWAAVVSWQWQDPAPDSAGIRLRMWQLAFAQWMNFPLTGIGPRVTHLLASSADSALHDYSHFHSGYIEALLRTGLIGIVAYGAAAFIVIRTSLKANAAGVMPKPMIGLLGALLLLFMALNLTETVLYFQQGWQFLTLVAGIAYGYRWRLIDHDGGALIEPAAP